MAVGEEAARTRAALAEYEQAALKMGQHYLACEHCQAGKQYFCIVWQGLDYTLRQRAQMLVQAIHDDNVFGRLASVGDVLAEHRAYKEAIEPLVKAAEYASALYHELWPGVPSGIADEMEALGKALEAYEFAKERG